MKRSVRVSESAARSDTAASHATGMSSVAATEQGAAPDSYGGLSLRALDLLEDYVYMTRLKLKLVHQLTEEGANNVMLMSSTFHALDRKWKRKLPLHEQREENGDSDSLLDVWRFKRCFAGPLGLHDLECEVLFALFLREEERAHIAEMVRLAGAESSCDGIVVDSRSPQRGGHAVRCKALPSKRAVTTSSTALSNPNAGDRQLVVATKQQVAWSAAAESVVVDAGEVLLSLRKLCHSVSSQFHEILKRVRARRVDPLGLDRDGGPICPFYAKFVLDRKPPKRRAVFDFLTHVLRMTDSEAYLFLEYVSLAGDSSSSTNSNNSPHHHHHQIPLDGSYISAVLFEYPMPDDVAFPLLMSKFVEAVTNPMRANRCGLTFLLEELLFYCEAFEPFVSSNAEVQWRSVHDNISTVAARRVWQSESVSDWITIEHQWLRSEEPQGSSDAGAREASCGSTGLQSSRSASDNEYLGNNEDASYPIPHRYLLQHRWMDLGIFRRFCERVQCGLPMAEVELLYSFLATRSVTLPNGSVGQSSTPMVPFTLLVDEVTSRLPRVPPPEIQRVAALVRAHLASCGPATLNGLYAKLRGGVNANSDTILVPPIGFTKCLRELGVPSSVAPSVVLDALRSAVPHLKSFIVFLRGPTPPSRTAVIQKLFSLLLQDAYGKDEAEAHSSVSVATIRHRFDPRVAAQVEPSVTVMQWQRMIDALADGNHATGSKQSVARPLHLQWDSRDGSSPAVGLAATTQQLVSGDDFQFYWGNVAASIEDDAKFTMLLWKAFSMHRQRQARRTAANEHVDAATMMLETAIHGALSPAPASSQRRRFLDD